MPSQPPPYRLPGDAPQLMGPVSSGASGHEDRELILVFAIVWLAAAYRIGASVLGHEHASTETGFAAVAVLAIPVMLRRALVSFLPLRRDRH